MELLTLILESFWFFLPAGFANMAPVFFKKINFLNYPMDFNKSFRGKPIFGQNKTFRGFFFGILTAILIVYLQPLVYPETQILNYSDVNLILLGLVLGAGALLGDLIKSFIKRQLDIQPGQPWMPFDQMDWILGASLLTLLYIRLDLSVILTSIILFTVLHPIVNYIGYAIGIKSNKF